MLTTRDGRALDHVVVGQGPLVVSLHGTPSGHRLRPSLVAAAAEVGVRVASYARPGYAGSTRLPGRTVADCVGDVLALADALGSERFAVVGASGGGPHALACGALAPDRCAAVATVAGVGPWQMEGLDFLAGMGEGNEVEFGAAVEGEQPLRDLIGPWREQMLAGGVQGTYDALVTVLSPPDREAFSSDLAEDFHRGLETSLRDGVDGWVDDDLAFVRPWGFGLDEVRVPVHLWQGGQDLMVPPAHGQWLAEHLPTCTPHLLPDDGHLTLLQHRPAEILRGLTAALVG
jgi:pimeloyl-ACP methyl ester carboxylesterase